MKILILDDDVTLSLMLKTWLSKKGYDIQTAINVASAKKELEVFRPALIISDLRLPDDNGLSLLKWAKQYYPDVAFIMMTSYADIQTAVDAIKSGAYDYVSKPVNPEELLKKIQTAFSSVPKATSEHPKSKKEPSDIFIKGQSLEYRKVYEYVDLVAPTHLSVFIDGESGVGKEHIARMIHEKSKRAAGPFVPVDCGVMNKELSASDFFGHIKGSFTGAINNKKGHFEEADKGTLFLDEIGNLSPEVQMQLLRTLQEKTIKPVGASKEIDVDVRIVVATNENMEQAIAIGKFRRDLYHRINEFHLHMPTLKECKDDISLFAHHFLKKANEEIDKNITGFDEETLRLLQTYHWPGNIRELRNAIFRMVLIAPTDIITKDLLPNNICIEQKLS
ncbi:MAG: sigma-54 dependent transcriptional regulator [Dysgonamonadaceae bacterium]|jgi:two-component system response regulator HydG|nr:sigma-54 dependent transcriptional regulator [Dysgonamonadaceae bacterium]